MSLTFKTKAPAWTCHLTAKWFYVIHTSYMSKKDVLSSLILSGTIKKPEQKEQSVLNLLKWKASELSPGGFLSFSRKQILWNG